MNQDQQLTLKMLSGGPDYCKGGPCPTVYATNRGTLVVQGKLLTSESKTQIDIDPDEEAVEISPELVHDALAQIKQA